MPAVLGLFFLEVNVIALCAVVFAGGYTGKGNTVQAATNDQFVIYGNGTIARNATEVTAAGGWVSVDVAFTPSGGCDADAISYDPATKTITLNSGHFGRLDLYTAGYTIVSKGTCTIDWGSIGANLDVKVDAGKTLTFNHISMFGSGSINIPGDVTKTVGSVDLSGDENNVVFAGPEVPEFQPVLVDTVTIENATLTMRAGDTPVFTAKSAEPDKYEVYMESWTEEDTGREITSLGDSNDKNAPSQTGTGGFLTSSVWSDPITTYVDGKKYAYAICIESVPVYADDAKTVYLGRAVSFSANTKLVLNGTTYTFHSDRDMLDDTNILYRSVLTATAKSAEENIPPAPVPEEPVPKEPTVPPAPTTVTSPKTADAGNPIPLWVVSLAASLCIAGLSVMSRHRSAR